MAVVLSKAGSAEDLARIGAYFDNVELVSSLVRSQEGFGLGWQGNEGAS